MAMTHFTWIGPGGCQRIWKYVTTKQLSQAPAILWPDLTDWASTCRFLLFCPFLPNFAHFPQFALFTSTKYVCWASSAAYKWKLQDISRFKHCQHFRRKILVWSASLQEEARICLSWLAPRWLNWQAKEFLARVVNCFYDQYRWFRSNKMLLRW